MATNEILRRLEAVLAERKSASPDSSYVARLYAEGLNEILEKIGEEATETILAAKDFHGFSRTDSRDDVVRETADLWFHTLVMLSYLDVSHNEILAELDRRFGTSGIEEKARRTSADTK